jgi:hypothetical protein
MKRPKIERRWKIPAEPPANSVDVECLRSRLFAHFCGGLSLPLWPAYLPLFHIDSTCFLRHHAGIPAGPHSRESQIRDMQSDKSQRQESPSCPAGGFPALRDPRFGWRFHATWAISANKLLRQAAGGRRNSRCYPQPGETANGSTANGSGERPRIGMGEHGHSRVPQAGNPVVWKDQARQVHVGS